MKTLKITLKRSLAGRPEQQRKIVKSLGLRKMHHTVMHKDTPAIRGQIYKISHMVEVSEEAEA